MKLCLICKKPAKKLFEVHEKTLLHCPICDLTWTDDFKKPVYDDYHYDLTYAQSQNLFNNIFERLYKIAALYFKNPGVMLEIGSSVGNLLQVFKQNKWQTLGVEPSKKACDFSRRRGLPVRNGYFESINLPGKHFDLVVINQTLEHVINPLSVLTKINGLLKPGGIVLIGVPNFGSLSAKILKNKWYYILPEEHKWHFSPLSLTKLIDEAGFKKREYHAASGVFDYDNPVSEIIYSLTHLKKRFFSEILTLPTSYILTKLKLGTGLVMIAEKK